MAPVSLRLRVLPQILPMDGREIELRYTTTYIQWRYVADHNGTYDWQNLISTADITGPAGPAIELRTDGTFVQYRTIGTVPWIDLIPLSDITGPQGEQGPQGPSVSDGDKGDVVVSGGGAVWTVLREDAPTVLEWIGGTHPSKGEGATWLIQGFRYEEAAPGAVGAHIENAAGVKLYVLSDGPLNVIAFGVVGDRITDDYAALQVAFSAVPEGGSIYFPKRGGTLPSYYTSQSLVLTQNDVSVFSDPSAEYTEGLFSDQAIDIISVRAYGFRAHHMVFVGNGSTDVFATTNGIGIDRSSVGDAETYANLDAFITNCFFLNLKDCIRGKGRNVLAQNSMFSQSKRGVVGELHTYAGGTVSSFRGWRVLGNRFHNMGSQYHSATSVEPVPANLSLLDSWCVQMPLDSNMVSHIEVRDNNYDVGMAGFYKGPLAACVVDDNVGYLVNPILVYSPLTAAPAISLTANYVQSVSGNKVSARLFVDERRGHTIATSHMVINGTRNLHIENNALLNSTDRSLVLTETNGLRLSDTDIINANTRFAFDSVQRNAAQILTANNVRVKDLDISYNLGGTPYDTGLVMTGTGIKLRDTTVTEATTKYSIPAASLMSSDDDALAWQTPAMTNGFVLDVANSRGYRKDFDGYVHIHVTVTGGTDNVQAFFLPAGYRSSIPVIIPSIGTFSGARAIVNPSGSVVIDFDAGAPASCTIHAAFAAA